MDHKENQNGLFEENKSLWPFHCLFLSQAGYKQVQFPRLRQSGKHPGTMEMKEIFLMQSSTACVQMQRFLNHKGRMSLYEERQ
jgi:hypothetical protein